MDALSLIKFVLGAVMFMVGGEIGLRRWMLLTVAGIAAFAAFSMVRGCHTPLSSALGNFASSENADVISVLVLVLLPVLTIYTLGRYAMVKPLVITESLSPEIDRLLGAGYGLTLFIIILHILGR